MIQASSITKNFGGRVLFQNASFQINAGEKVGLVGPNGAGKSTLFRLIIGEEEVDAGNVTKIGKPVIGYFSQSTGEMSGRSVIDEVKSAVGVHEIESRLKLLESKLSEPLDDDEMAAVLEEYGNLQSKFEGMGGYDVESRAAEILTGLGIPPEDHARDTGTFSGGWKMRIALAKILALKPDLLLMDEPTNHLDMESILWLEEWLRNYPGAVFMTSHDRAFINGLVKKIVEVANKSITTYSGNYDFYERERDIRREQLIATAKRQEEMLAKEEEFIARFAARASHAAQVQSRVKKIEKIEKIEIPPEEKAIHFEWPPPPRGGDDVVKFSSLGKTWVSPDGKEKCVFAGAAGLVKRLDRVAVVGINGAGKSTLLKMVVGQTEPTEGVLQLGSGIRLGYFSQNSLEVLNPANTVMEEFQYHNKDATIGYTRNLLGAFKFSGDDVEKKVSVLSGGEKSRLLLGILMAQAPNFLVLDEPTNHLDMLSREVLLDAILTFPGTVMIVSHDRYFLGKITTRVFEVDRSKITITEGPWEYYLSKKKDTSLLSR